MIGMREYYEKQLEDLNKQLVSMGNACQKSIEITVRALEGSHQSLSWEVSELCDRIQHMEREIEEKCMKLLLLQQPVASDLRKISSALKIVTDMERIGIQAGDIGEMILTGETDLSDSQIPLKEMAEETVRMLKDSMKAFLREDLDLARQTMARDDRVDSLFLEIKRELSEKPGKDGSAIDLVIIAKYYERIGDHAENIADWVIYSITGEHEKVKK